MNMRPPPLTEEPVLQIEVPRRAPESGADFQRLADAITAISGAREAEEIIEIVRRSARGLSGARGIAVIFNDDGFCHYLVEDSESPLWAGRRFPAESCISGWAMIHNRTVVIPDIFEDPRIPHDAYRATFVRSLIMTPIGEDRPFAAVGAYWGETGAPDPEEVMVMQALARSTAIAFKNLQLYDSLKREAARSEILHQQAQDRLAEREKALAQIRFQAGLLDAVEQAVIAIDLDGKVTYWSRFAEQLYGWTAQEAAGRSVLDLIVPSEGRQTAAAIMASLAGGRSWSGETILMSKNGEAFPAHVTDSPILDADGRFLGIVGVSADITERRKSEQHLRLMVNELNHRVKNSLATVQSVASQTFRTAGSTTEAKSSFETRLLALSLIHEMLTEANWDSADLREIAQRIMGAHVGPEDGRATLRGPTVRLSTSAATSLAMGLNELATNAIKHGALSNADGRIDIDWSVASGPRGRELALNWRETGGPTVAPPQRHGFGERLLMRGLPYDLESEVKLDYLPTGLAFSLRAPISAIQPRPQDPRLAL